MRADGAQDANSAAEDRAIDAPEPTLDVAALLGRSSTADLLQLYGTILDELRKREVVRSRNAPAGDLAEHLTVIVYGGGLAPPSAKSWDVRAADDRLVQVKCRVVRPG